MALQCKYRAKYFVRNAGWILSYYVRPRNNIITTETTSGTTNIGKFYSSWNLNIHHTHKICPETSKYW